MKNVKKIVSIALAALMLTGIFAGCGGGKTVETNPDGSTVQGKTAIVAYNSAGYGHKWLETLAEEFNKMYALILKFYGKL